MALLVEMPVIVRDSLVGVLVIVAFDQVQPHAEGHEHWTAPRQLTHARLRTKAMTTGTGPATAGLLHG